MHPLRTYQREDRRIKHRFTNGEILTDGWGSGSEMRGTHLCALGVLETSLEERHGGVGVEVDEEVGTAGKDAKGGLTGEDVGAVRHSEDLGAEGVPWVTALGRVV